MNSDLTANRMAFSAPWGRPVKVISLLGVAMCLGVSSIGLTSFTGALFARLLLLISPLLVVFGVIPFMILGFTLEKETLMVRRLGWSTRIPLAGLKTAVFDPDALRGSIRLVGNGGLFAFNGLFRNDSLGNFRAFVTDPRRSVVLQLKDRTVVISPGSPEAFVKALASMEAL